MSERMKEQQAEELNEHKRLAQAYEDDNRPFHERNALFFRLATVGGWLSNVVSGVTEAARIYWLVYGIVGSIVFGIELTAISTVMGIIVLEGSNRLFASSYFKAWVRNGGHTAAQNANLAGMIICFSISAYLSITGNFDAIKIIREKEKPMLLLPDAQTPEDVSAAYDPLIAAANKRAKDYFDSRKWMGRIAGKDKPQYDALLNHAKELEASKALALEQLAESNREVRKDAQSQYEMETAAYNAEIQQTGIGLVVVTVPSILILYLSLWYSHLYRFKKKQFLDRKYGVVPDQAQPAMMGHQGGRGTAPPRGSPGQLLADLLQQHPQMADLLQQMQGHPPNGAGNGAPRNVVVEEPPPPYSPETGRREAIDLQAVKQPVGYRSQEERAGVAKGLQLLQRVASLIERREDVNGFDKYTILHFRFTDNEPVRHPKERIDWYVENYTRKVEELKSGEDTSQRVLENALAKKFYWENRQNELYRKMGIF